MREALKGAKFTSTGELKVVGDNSENGKWKIENGKTGDVVTRIGALPSSPPPPHYLT